MALSEEERQEMNCKFCKNNQKHQKLSKEGGKVANNQIPRL